MRTAEGKGRREWQTDERRRVKVKEHGNPRAEGIERLEWLAHHTQHGCSRCGFAVGFVLDRRRATVQNETGFGRVGIVDELLELVLMHYGKKV